MSSSILNAPAIRQLILKSSKLSILIHKNPDGDALGSGLALYNFLRTKGKKSFLLVPDAYPHYFRYLPGREKMIVADKNPQKASEILNQSNLIFALDFNRFDRLGCLQSVTENLKVPKILIDHHPDPDTAQWNFMYHYTSASSTSELLFEFIQNVFPTDPLTADVATCLYTGIIMDTGGFMHNFSSKTYKICASLLEFGARSSEVNENLFQKNSLDRIRLMGYSLYEKLFFNKEYGFAYISLTQEEMKRFNFKKGDSEGFVNMILSIEGVFVAILITEQDNQITRLSLRSRGHIPVNNLAEQHFNGGGHLNAAGGQIEGNAKKAEALISEILPLWLKSYLG